MLILYIEVSFFFFFFYKRICIKVSDIFLSPFGEPCSLHYTTVKLGTPGVKFMVALDTGSDLFWVPCDCSQCAPTEGTTYASVCSLAHFLTKFATLNLPSRFWNVILYFFGLLFNLVMKFLDRKIVCLRVILTSVSSIFGVFFIRVSFCFQQEEIIFSCATLLQVALRCGSAWMLSKIFSLL